MTLREKLGQMVMIPFFGEFMSAEGEEFQALARAVEEQHIGGLIVHTRFGAMGLERSRAYPTAALLNLLQRRARIPLLVAADFERGTVMRLEDGTSFPHAMAVAATGRPDDAYAVGRVTALEARAAGVQWIFAPVADVNSNPANPIINIRSFGEDPKRVAEFVTEYVRGVQEHGTLATAKHFPGHGNTNVDSHLDLPTVPSERSTLETVEIVPFRAAIAAGVSTIMTGHLAVPALESDPESLTTFSKKITTDLLRRRMGFNGLIVTDDLSMGGVSRRHPAGEAAVRSILAGADVLLAFRGTAVPALAALQEAAESGRLPKPCIDDAVMRILQAKAQLALPGSRCADLNTLPKTFGRAEFRQVAADIADRGITLLRDEEHHLPLDATRPLRVLLVAVAGDPDRSPGYDLEQELRWRVDSLEVLRADTRFAKVGSLAVPPMDSYDLLLVAMFVRITASKGEIGLPAEQAAFVHRLLAENKSAVVVCFGNPYLMAEFPETKTWLAAFSSAEVAQRAAVRALFGQIPIGGKIPVSIPGAIAMGAGTEVPASPMTLALGGASMDARFSPVYELMERAVADRAFPGAVAAVGHRGKLAVRAFGKFSYGGRAPRVTPNTIYDAASLTKPVVTATLAAMLQEAGQLQVDAPVARYAPEWTEGPDPAARAKVTVRHLLTHTAGLPAHQDYFLVARTRREIISRVLAEPLIAEPGAQSVYSDLSFILLGEIIERITGEPVERLAKERIFAPLGMKDTFFRPPKSLRARIAPTEEDRGFRKRMLRGEVHDENAWVMGGVAGHAGMFSTAPDLAVFCQMMLNGGIYAHRRLLRGATVARFTAAEPISGNIRTLGWMLRDAFVTSGRKLSPASYGYMGFTGVSMWIDPEKELVAVLLTNRVHPTRENDKIHQVRRAFHELVVDSLAG
jgi:beta-glucosidase-like glycosyl hydrolase/CubicO group peptidase (beta-lactamase class C family)